MNSLVWNADAVSLGLDEIAKHRQQLLASLKTLLDDFHRANRPLRYYDVIAGDWLEMLIHAIYVAYHSVMTHEQHSREGGIPVAGDTADFLQLTLEPCFHDYLRAIVASILIGESLSCWRFDRDKLDVSLGRSEWRHRLLKGSFSTTRPKLLICNPYYKCSTAEWLAALWKWRRWAKWDDFDYPISYSCHIDQDWRRERAAANCPVRDFSDLMQVMLPLSIPAVLLEGFVALRDKLLALKILPPRALYTANALHSNLTFKVLAAEWQGQGTKILNHQHGGSYGLDRVHVIEQYESRVSDRFYSWGWHSNTESVRAMSAPNLPTLHRSRQRLLLNCVDFPRTVYRLHFHPMPGTIETLVLETVGFVVGLPEKSALLIRFPHIDYGWGMRSAIQVAAPWVAFDLELPSAFQRYAESRLIVHNYLGTGWLETLALNIPTVCFFDSKTYAFRAQAQPYIDALEGVGILHRSGLDAARHVAEMWKDPDGWWQGADIQSVRRDFVARYANFSPDWPRQWEREFSGLLERQ